MTDWNKLESHLRDVCSEGLDFRRQVSSSELTTFTLGAPVPLVIEPKTVPAAQKLVQNFFESGIEWRILGGGSNIILPDRELNYPIIRLGRYLADFFYLNHKHLESPHLTDLLEVIAQRGEGNTVDQLSENLLVMGGVPLMGLSRRLSSSALSGVEFAAGIPGTVGGGIKMNCGAHGKSFSEIVRECLVLDGRGELKQLNREQLNFAYRKSGIARDELVVASLLQLKAGEKEEISATRTRCLEYRRQTQPLTLPSAGSTFKNPSQPEEFPGTISKEFGNSTWEIPAAAVLLEQVGMKGKQLGGVGFSKMHANWLVKLESTASCSDALKLIDLAIEQVNNEFGIVLEPEVQVWKENI
jgi:UDP-N-acetylmuramate dehydrogenase